MSRSRGRTEDSGYGLGLVTYSTPCGEAIGHFGQNVAYAAGVFAIPSTGRVVDTANSGSNDTLQFLVGKGLCS